MRPDSKPTPAFSTTTPDTSPTSRAHSRSAGAPDLLRDLFSFHGAITRVAVVHGVGFIEFASATSTESSLMFDRTRLGGQTVSVAVVEDSLPEELWVVSKVGSSTESVVPCEPRPFPAVVADAVVPPSPPDAYASRLPAPSRLPPPSSSPAIAASPAAAPASANGRPSAAPATPSSSPSSGLGPAARWARERGAALEHLATEPLNSLAFFLAATLALQLVLVFCYSYV